MRFGGAAMNSTWIQVLKCSNHKEENWKSCANGFLTFLIQTMINCTELRALSKYSLQSTKEKEYCSSVNQTIPPVLDTFRQSRSLFLRISRSFRQYLKSLLPWWWRWASIAQTLCSCFYAHYTFITQCDLKFSNNSHWQSFMQTGSML